jgi:hypothetical protein
MMHNKEVTPEGRTIDTFVMPEATVSLSLAHAKGSEDVTLTVRRTTFLRPRYISEIVETSHYGKRVASKTLNVNKLKKTINNGTATRLVY